MAAGDHSGAPMQASRRFVNVEDFRAAAHRFLPRIFADYIDGGSFSETSLRRNREDFDLIRLRQKVLVPVQTVDLSTSLHGQAVALPFGPGPVGFTGLYRHRGDVAIARAAHKAGVPSVLSTFSINGLKTVADAVGAAPDFQLYLDQDPAETALRLQMARDVGVRRIFLTVDTAVTSVRERDVRNGFRSVDRITAPLLWQFIRRPAWSFDVLRGGFPEVEMVRGRPEFGKGALAQAGKLSSRLEKSLSWEIVQRLRDQWRGELIIKGLMDGEDIRRAREHGADGVVVSNHGGRQLDHGSSTISKVKDARQALGPGPTLYVDGGFRRGADVIKAIALGADFVLMGRPFAWAVAAGGEESVSMLFELLKAEMAITLQLMGVPSVAALAAAGEAALDGYPQGWSDPPGVPSTSC